MNERERKGEAATENDNFEGVYVQYVLITFWTPVPVMANKTKQ